MNDLVACTPINGLALCAGIGGLELGLHLALGGRYRTVCHVERDAYAASALVARMEDKALGQSLVWDDLETFNGNPWRGLVDLVSAGFPCQPFSAAGKRAGTSDARWLWNNIARILGEVRPRYVFLENVRGILAPSQHDALAAVLGTLADLGYNAEWDVFSAAEVGAPHKRERFFLLGHTHEPGLEGWQQSQRSRGYKQPVGTPSTEVGHTHGERCDGIDPRLQQRGSLEVGLEAQWSDPQSPFPPGPGCGPEDWPRGEPEPAVRRAPDGVSPELVDRTDRLRCLGNGVVPLVAAHAFQTLAARLGLPLTPTRDHP